MQHGVCVCAYFDLDADWIYFLYFACNFYCFVYCILHSALDTSWTLRVLVFLCVVCVSVFFCVFACLLASAGTSVCACVCTFFCACAGACVCALLCTWQAIHIRKTDKLVGKLREARDPPETYELGRYFEASDALARSQQQFFAASAAFFNQPLTLPQTGEVPVVVSKETLPQVSVEYSMQFSEQQTNEEHI